MASKPPNRRRNLPLDLQSARPLPRPDSEALLELLLPRFRALCALRPPRKEKAAAVSEREIRRTLYTYYRLQEEAFHIAQAITTLLYPGLQAEINRLRAEIVLRIRKYLDEQEPPTTYGPSRHYRTIAPVPIDIRNWDWRKFDLTPGLAQDPRIAGVRLPSQLVRDLKALHRAQIQTLSRLT